MLALFGACLWFLLISWEFAVSVCMIGMIALFLWEWHPEKGRWVWRQNLPTALARWRSDPSWAVTTIPFLLVLLTALWSEDHGYTIGRLRVKVPFVVLALAFSGLPVGDRRTYQKLHALLLAGVCVAAIPVLAEYLADRPLWEEVLRQGRSLPTPSSHIRFSMAAALAFLGGLYLWEEGFVWRWSFERWLIPGLTLFLFVFLHILSVRTGLVGLYAGLGIWVLRWILVKGRRAAGIFFLILIGITPWLAYRGIPAFRAKIDYMLWDLDQHWRGHALANSDSNRIVSWHLAWEIFRQNPWLGTGIGDVRREMHARYAAEAPHHQPVIPHNQWLYMLAGSGILGTLVFGVFVFLPLFWRRRYRLFPFLALHTVFFLSYLIEPTLENNFGISLLLLFHLPGLRQET